MVRSVEMLVVVVVNPRHACVRVTVVVLYICVYVCYQACYYIPHLFIESPVPLGFLISTYVLCGSLQNKVVSLTHLRLPEFQFVTSHDYGTYIKVISLI